MVAEATAGGTADGVPGASATGAETPAAADARAGAGDDTGVGDVGVVPGATGGVRSRAFPAGNGCLRGMPRAAAQRRVGRDAVPATRPAGGDEAPVDRTGDIGGARCHRMLGFHGAISMLPHGAVIVAEWAGSVPDRDLHCCQQQYIATTRRKRCKAVARVVKCAKWSRAFIRL
jgi:hypothetical protein